MKVTLKDIAKKSGYGYGTVARALSADPALVKDETREKILAVAKKCGYAKDLTAQALVSGKTQDIGLVVPAMFDSPYYVDFYMKTIAGIMNGLASKEFRLRVLFLREKGGFQTIAQEAKSLKLGGLIMAPYIREYFIEDKDIRKLQMPVVTLGRHVKGQNVRSIMLDDLKGGYDGAKYLVGLGHRKIGIIRGVFEDIEARYHGYRKALKDSKVKIDDDFIIRGDAKEKTGFSCTLELLKKKKRPTAIFALDDEMAIGAIKAVKEMGLKCPEDVSVMGYDGIEISAYTDPALTTVARPVVLMGESAVEMLLNKKKWREKKVLKVRANIMERSSCSRARK